MASDKKYPQKTHIGDSTANECHGSQNVHHSFDSVNKDRDKNKPRYVYLKFVPSVRPRLERSVSVTPEITNPDDLLISTSLRDSVCSGYPVLRGSHSRIVHNSHIFKEHFENLALEQQRQSRSFRRKKDWLGRWTEANIVRDRLLKDMINAQKKTSTTTVPT